MPVKHTFVNPKSDGGDATVTRPSDWNAAHVIELDYAEFTSPVSITATTEGGADTVITGASVAYDGSTIVLIEFFAPDVEPASSTVAAIFFILYEDGSSIGIIGVAKTVAAQGYQASVHLARRMTPTNASHTYSIRAYRSVGNGTVVAGAGGSGNYLPGFIRITKV